jgi:hypothetical protein
MECDDGPHTAVTIALHGGVYLAIMMDRYERPHTSLTIALHRGLYLAIIMDCYEGHHTALTIDLHIGLCLATIMDPYKCPKLPYYNLAERPLLSHYNGPS